MKKKVLYVALCHAVCPDNAKYCEWFTVADGTNTPLECPVKMADVIAAIEGGRLKLSRKILRHARWYVRKKERDFRNHPEYLDCIKPKENPPK